MAMNTKIEWCDHTDNLWHGCTKVHSGCDNCYAETLSIRWNRDIWGPDKPRMEIKSVFKDFKKQQKDAAALNIIRTAFVGSMMDIFEKPMPLVDNKGEMVTDGIHYYPANTGQVRDEYFDEVVPFTPNILHLMLTKRPSNILKFIPEDWAENPPANVMYGTSPCDQETFDKLWLQLARVRGKRFLSIEPMIGRIVMKAYCPLCDKLLAGSLSPTCGTCHSSTIKPDWVICGGESGHVSEIRPMHPDWPRALRDQCKLYGIPFFFKQWGKFLPKCQADNRPPGIITENKIVLFPSPHNSNKMNEYYNIGKHNAGNILDGRVHTEKPTHYTVYADTIQEEHL